MRSQLKPMTERQAADLYDLMADMHIEPTGLSLWSMTSDPDDGASDGVTITVTALRHTLLVDRYDVIEGTHDLDEVSRRWLNHLDRLAKAIYLDYTLK